MLHFKFHYILKFDWTIELTRVIMFMVKKHVFDDDADLGLFSSFR